MKTALSKDAEHVNTTMPDALDALSTLDPTQHAFADPVPKWEEDPARDYEKKKLEIRTKVTSTL